MTCKFCGSPLPDGAMICDLCGNNQKASKPVGAFSFEGSKPATEKKGKPADRWNTGPSASMEGAGTDDIVPVKTKRKKVHGSFPIKKILVVLLVLALIGGAGFGAWYFILNRGVDENEEIVESFKKVVRAKNAEYSISVTSGSTVRSITGGFYYDKSEKKLVSWNTEENKLVVTILTEKETYNVTMTSERYYNLYLSNPNDYPNEKIIMIGSECFDIKTITGTESDYKQMENIFNDKWFDSMEQEQADAELLASMTAEEKKYYDAIKKFQDELTDPNFMKDVLNAKRNKISSGIVYEFDVDLAKFMQIMYSSMSGVLPAGYDLSQLSSATKETLEKLGIKCTGRLTIHDGYFSILSGEISMQSVPYMKLDMRIENPGRTEYPENVKKMVDSISLLK
ncbi:MAG: hypothetical protein J5757_10290 [Lachnospiraceae bacterium]|nr:hypothetical protein [Lachnospiraceae bacterium]